MPAPASLSYAKVMMWVPAPSAVERVAELWFVGTGTPYSSPQSGDRGSAPRACSPSKKITPPRGGGMIPYTVAVNVTVVHAEDGFCDDPRSVNGDEAATRGGIAANNNSPMPATASRVTTAMRPADAMAVKRCIGLSC